MGHLLAGCFAVSFLMESSTFDSYLRLTNKGLWMDLALYNIIDVSIKVCMAPTAVLWMSLGLACVVLYITAVIWEFQTERGFVLLALCVTSVCSLSECVCVWVSHPPPPLCYLLSWISCRLCLVLLIRDADVLWGENDRSSTLPPTLWLCLPHTVSTLQTTSVWQFTSRSRTRNKSEL